MPVTYREAGLAGIWVCVPKALWSGQAHPEGALVLRSTHTWVVDEMMGVDGIT